jgi:2',3'-cyclic-nucleotide 2'-phosphodiesterase (5'-nucleotidase family)
MIRPGSALERLSDLRFQSWRETARSQVEALRPEVEWLVAISHLGPEADEELATLCPELDLLLSGHGHPAALQTTKTGNVTQVSPAPYLREVVYLRSSQDYSPSAFEVEAIKL